MTIHSHSWGRGDPVIALHPLGLDGSALAGLGRALAAHGLRTLALDLPGFGRSPAPERPLTPAELAAPVIARARSLEARPALIGISMGGRVALEAALAAPELFRFVVPIAPYLPWLRLRWAMPLAHLMSPELAARIPLERIWPLLRWWAHLLESLPVVRDDEIAKSGVRMIYYASCPATRAAIVSAAREMALDPAFGPDGLWDRLPDLEVPAAFIWGGQDRLVPVQFSGPVGEALPRARQQVLPCLRHAINGGHARCLADAVAHLLTGTRAPRSSGRKASARLFAVPCSIDAPASGKGAGARWKEHPHHA